MSDILSIQEVEVDLDCDGHAFALATFDVDILYHTDGSWSVSVWRFQDGTALSSNPWPMSMQASLVKQLDAMAEKDTKFRARVQRTVDEAIPYVDESAEHKLLMSEVL